MARQGMTVGEGDLYTSFEPECYLAIMNVLNNPDNPWYGDLEAYSGLDISTIRAIMGRFVFSQEYNVYYWPEPCVEGEDPWDLLGGDYSDLAMAFEEIGWDEGVDCGIGAITIINSHQGVGGL